jgi:hypothetical protein
MTPSPPSDAAKGRWPATLTTERANPLRRRNPDWGGCPTARRPVAAVNVFFPRRPVFVKRLTRETTPRGAPARAPRPVKRHCAASTRSGWNKYVAILRWRSYHKRHEDGATVGGGEHGGRKYAPVGDSAQACPAIGCTMLAQLSVVAAESRDYAHRTRHIVCLRQRAGSCVTPVRRLPGAALRDT